METDVLALAHREGQWRGRAISLTFALALAATVTHVAHTFSTLETGGPPAFLDQLARANGLMAALAIELGSAVIAWTISTRRRHRRPTRVLWSCLMFLVTLSAFANFDHAMAVIIGGPVSWQAIRTLDHWLIVRAVALSATLPLVVFVLATIREDLHGDQLGVMSPFPVASEPATTLAQTAALASTAPRATQELARESWLAHSDGREATAANSLDDPVFGEHAARPPSAGEAGAAPETREPPGAATEPPSPSASRRLRFSDVTADTLEFGERAAAQEAAER